MSENLKALAVNNKVLFTDADWSDLRWYKVAAIAPKLTLREFTDFFNAEAEVEVAKEHAPKLWASPFSTEMVERYPREYYEASMVQDLACSHLRNGSLEVALLVEQLKNDRRLTSFTPEFVTNVLRACVASSLLVVTKGAGSKSTIRKLALSADATEIERRRAFAGSVAGELVSQSRRIRDLIDHTSTVGTYRENILQSLLRKSVPERYHVATGFVFGCKRQIDILIYDRIEYAPVFREGDLVVVQPEAVRAVIEVKTDLSKVALQESLELLDQVSALDDCMPPFFKGIFGFNSKLTPAALNNIVIDYYKFDYDEDEDIEIEKHNPIFEPFKHLTSACVLEHYYSEISYGRKNNKGSFIPALLCATSATDLNLQAAHFIHKLLGYLKTAGLKNADGNRMLRLLGADSAISRAAFLAPDSWGLYFALEQGMPGTTEEDVEEMEANISAVIAWLGGAPWELQRS